MFLKRPYFNAKIRLSVVHIMSENRVITFCMALFLLPLILFLSYWTEWWVAIPLVLGALFSLCRLSLVEKSQQLEWGKSAWAKLLLAALVLLFYQWMVGYTGAFPQFSDFSARNAQYSSLCRESWPMASKEGYPFVYYFSSWLPSALLTKLTFFEWRNYNQMFFNFALMLAAYVVLCVKLRRISLLALLGIICLADLPSLLDAVVAPVAGEGMGWRFSSMFNLRAAAPSLLTQCSHTANHGPIIMLAVALMLLRYKRLSIYLLIGSCALLYSPLGALALFVLLLVQCLRRGVLSSVFQILRQPLSYISVAIVGVAVIFYTQNSGSATQFELGLRNVEASVMHYFYIFWVGQCLFFFILFYPQNRRSPLFWAAYLSFICLPFISYGTNYNEVIFKASLVFWVCSVVFFVRIFKPIREDDRKLVWRRQTILLSKILAYGVICCFVINTLVQMPRKFAQYNHPSNVVDPYDSDYYSEKALKVRQSKSRYRDFGGMRDEEANPWISGILRKPSKG